MGRTALHRLQKKGVEVILEARVTAIKGSRVIIAPKHGANIIANSSFVIWSGGVTPNIIPPSHGYSVTPSLQVVKHPFAFAIGDVTSSASTYPALAQVASHQGAHAARMICRLEAGDRVTPFSWKDHGRLVSVGQKYAVGKIMGVRLSGVIAWFIMRTVYLFKFNSTRYGLRAATVYTKRLFSRLPHGKRA